MPFVCFVTPQLPWYWATPFMVLAGVLLGQRLPDWRGHALIWTFLGVVLALRVPWPLSLILPCALLPYLGDSKDVRHVLRFELTGEVLACVREALTNVRRDAGPALDDEAALLLMARAVLAGPRDLRPRQLPNCYDG